MAPVSLSGFCWFKIVLLLCVFRQGRVLMASCEIVPAMFDPETKQVISIQDKLVHRKKIWS